MSEAALQISPEELVELHRYAIVDIRSLEERRDPSVGLIPGSLWFPAERLRTEPMGLTELLEAPPEGVVLACLTGRRSADLVAEVEPLGFPLVRTLRGGLLAWAAAHPVCRLGHPRAPQEPTLARRRLTACFVAESVENTLERDLEDAFDPKSEVHRIVDEALARHDNPAEGWVEAIERLAALARHRGHPVGHVASNVERVLDEIADS